MRLSRLVPTALLILLATGIPSNAQTVYTWNNTGSDWNTAADWTPNGVPTAADTALFGPNGSLFGTPVINPSLSAGSTGLSVTFALNQNFGGWTLTGNGIPLSVGGAGSTGITTYGPQTTVLLDVALAGNASAPGLISFNVTTSSTLTLAGSTSVTANQGTVSILGGTFRLDNSVVNVPARLLPTTVDLDGGGTFELVGNSAGTTTTVGALTVVDNSKGGLNTIRVSPNGASTVLVFGNTGTFTLRAGTRNATRFVATSGALGDAAGGQIKFTGTPFTSPTAGAGLFANTATGATVGFGTVSDTFGINFATYNGTGTSGLGVVSIANPASGITINTVTDTTTGFVAAANNQLNITAATTVPAGGPTSALTLRISPGAGATLDMGTNALNSTALMIDGPNDFAITGTGNFGPGTGARYIYVNNPNATLSVSLVVSTAGNPTLFVGPGTVVLTGAGNQNASTTNDRQSLLGGVVLRASNAQFNFTATGGGVIDLTGGVLEIAGGTNGTGAAADFRRALGTAGVGSVNFGGGTTNEIGSGGFSAFGAPASVNIGGASANLIWNQINFIGDGFALLFGSTKSNAVLRFENPLQLDNGTTIPYQPREIRVTAGTGGDKTVFSGAITGAALADLVKTGTGVLELTAANTYSGNTLVTAGTLSGTGSIIPTTAGGSVRVASGATLNPGTYAATSSPGALTMAEPVRFASGSNFRARITTATPGVTANSGLSSGALPANGANNGFLNVTGVGNTLSIPTGTNIVIDGTGTTFTTGTLYSYSIAQANSAAELSLGSSFTFTPVGFNATGYSLTTNGNVVNLNFTAAAVPEPATMLGLGAAGLGLAGWMRRRRAK